MTREVIARRLGSRWCCAWQVVLTLFVLGLIFSVSWNPVSGVGGYLNAIAIELAADAIAAAVVGVASITVLRSRYVKTQPVIVVVLVWILIAVVRGLAMFYFVPNDPARVMNSNVTIPIWALVVIYLFAAYDETRSHAVQLGVANAGLRSIQDDTQALLSKERQRLVVAVQEGITAEIAQLKQHVAVLARPGAEGQLSELADRVAAYSVDVVRETSHQLRGSGDVVVRDDARTGAGSVRKPSLFSAYLRARQPIWIPMALIISKGVSVWILRWDPAPLRSQPIAFGLMVLIMWGGRRLIERFVKRPSWSEIVLSSALVLATAGAVVWAFGATRVGGSSRDVIPLPTVGLYIVGIFIAARLFAAVQQRWNDLSRELEAVNAQITEANARLSEDLAVTREQLADVLHGPVQGRLAAASMVLRLYADAGEEGREVDYATTVATAVELLDRALVDLSQLGRISEPRWTDVSSGFEQIKQMWSGLVAVRWTINDHWTRSQGLVDGIVDLVSEVVTNASRHADARSVTIAVLGRDARSVMIEAVDDGCGPKSDVRAGKGLSAVAKFNGSWSIERRPDGMTRVELVLQDVNPLPAATV